MRNFQIEPTRGDNKKSALERVESVAASSENPGLATVTVSGGGKIMRSEATVRNFALTNIHVDRYTQYFLKGMLEKSD